jgi:(E)-4-hydroxy-3-methylbut-2-enyl-diphosphate synthase
MRQTRAVTVKGVRIGGGAPVVVQSMTKTETTDVEGTVAQIDEMMRAGCEVVRVAVPNAEAAVALKEIRRRVPDVPLVADIHFHYKLALMALEAGVDKLRLNPGNIGSIERVREVVRATKERGVPIRIGVNAGSLDPDIKEKYGLTPRALIESAKRELSYFDKEDFHEVIISLKASDVRTTVAAYRLGALELGDYPLHLGVTEAGLVRVGTVKSAMGLGTLLAEGIGDTLRVSLTGDPVEEVKVGWDVLAGLELRRRGVNVISCPSCGRCDIDVVPLAGQVADAVSRIKNPISVAVMGCEVNGPGEAKSADYGIAGGNGISLIFKKGEIVARAKPDEQLATLMNVINEDLAKAPVQAEE